MKHLIPVIALVGLSACATKGYHIAAPLSDDRASRMSCAQLAFELEEVREIEDSIEEEAETDYRSIGGILGDFGIGNAIARDRAEEALRERRTAIESAQLNKGCG